MDWGLAKLLGAERDEGIDAAQPPPAELFTEANPDQTTDHPSAEKSTGNQTQTGQAVGTPAYMPPEQARGEVDRIGPTSDVFALGGMLCVVLTGKPPYTGRGGREVLDKAAATELADAFTRLDACDADPNLITLCKQCLGADPAGRPADAGAVAALVSEYRD